MKLVTAIIILFFIIFPFAVHAETILCDPNTGKNCFSCSWIQNSCGVSLVDQYCLDGYTPDYKRCNDIKEKDSCNELALQSCKPLKVCEEPSSCYIWDGTTETGCPYGYKRDSESYCINTELLCCTSELFEEKESYNTIVESQRQRDSQSTKKLLIQIAENPTSQSIAFFLAIAIIALYLKHKQGN